MERYLFSFQMMHKSQFYKLDSYDWFCAPGVTCQVVYQYVTFQILYFAFIIYKIYPIVFILAVLNSGLEDSAMPLKNHMQRNTHIFNESLMKRIK